jgi:hypothetical protein
LPWLLLPSLGGHGFAISHYGKLFYFFGQDFQVPACGLISSFIVSFPNLLVGFCLSVPVRFATASAKR